MSHPISVLCALCGESFKGEADHDAPGFFTSAFAVALHFSNRHPEVGNDLESNLIITENV